MLDIYYRHLAPKGRGSPLWIPEPNKQLPIEYQRTGMLLGDVGILAADGSFDFLFNACLPRDHPVNPQRMPEDYEPFILDPLDVQRQSEFKGASHLSSASIKRSCSTKDLQGLEFESTASEGAILTMPVGSNSADVRNIILLRRYAALHAENWYRYVVNIRGREAENGDVRFVTGFDKTTAWGMATFANSTEQRDSFQLRFRAIEDGTVGKMYRWESHSGMAESLRVGPDASEVEALRMNDPQEEGKEYENQSLFVRTLNVTLQGNVWRKLKQELGEVDVGEGDEDEHESQPPEPSPWAPNADHQAGPSSGSPATQRGSGSVGARLTFKTRGGSSTRKLTGALTFHPSRILNDMVLDAMPHARMAITEDRHWMSIMSEHDAVLPSDEELRQRISQMFTFYEVEGVAILVEKSDSADCLAQQGPYLQAIPAEKARRTSMGSPAGIQALQDSFDKLIFGSRGRFNPSEKVLPLRLRRYSPNRED
ncbi:hypothetical protein D9613_008361 [Agrocybe pediades]|uniref:Uncharacterized protein n=1 Tax=Agrocybe pediades TaxID=84607 RepID=A0A8H4VNT7_9AGAR|nr:hypothetical protein D9613_008361 [Agrocybe pediades]